MWQFQLSLSSIVSPSDFVVETCSTRIPSIETVRVAVRVFSLGPDLISINLVLVSLCAFNAVKYADAIRPH